MYFQMPRYPLAIVGSTRSRTSVNMEYTAPLCYLWTNGVVLL